MQLSGCKYTPARRHKLSPCVQTFFTAGRKKRKGRKRNKTYGTKNNRTKKTNKGTAVSRPKKDKCVSNNLDVKQTQYILS